MNTQTNTMPESFGSQGIAPAVVQATRPMYWSVRRELWENRSIYIAPLATVAVILVGFVIGTAVAALHPEKQGHGLTKHYEVAAGFMMVTAMLVGVFYCLDALRGERRDRSILFWKSLPISDLTAVLSKAAIPLLILPLINIVLSVAVLWLMLLVSCVVLVGRGQSVGALWMHLSLPQMTLLLVYHLVTVHWLWHAPLYGWLLLVSAWARRATVLWATLPLLAIGFGEKILFGTSYLAAMMGRRLEGGPEAMTFGEFPMDPMTHLTPGRFLMSPGLWLGLIVTAGFLAAAVRMRRYRGPI
ncbi:MAG TPA: ABC transporter permease [Candidatus Dormibacteraeota bacterium]|nr:ABC transporter permease [Candidatus Dormibacteraeota bacterium]